MESLHYFKVYYNKEFVCSISAHTKWEAMDRAYYMYASETPNLERSKFSTTKIY